MKGKNVYTCDKCNSKSIHNEEFDAYYCENCNIWLEDKCGDEKCRFCVPRTNKPSDIMEGFKDVIKGNIEEV